MSDVYTGHWDDTAPCLWNAYPGTRYMTEKELIAWVSPAVLAGLWVNHCLLLDCVPPECVVVVMRDGTRRRLTEHPKWATWAGTMTPGEFYSHAGADW
jgi:hypothetical protein